MQQVCIFGSGQWGTTIGKLIAENVKPKNSQIKSTIVIWIFEEKVNGKSMMELINVDHKNPKYLPGVTLPNNLIGNPHLESVVKMADILIFALPHQFLSHLLKDISGHVKSNARAISLMKGIIINKGNGLVLLSDMITKHLKIDCAVVMGANRAGEVSSKIYGEATIGCRDETFGKLIKSMFQTDYLKLVLIKDVIGVELCSSLKNIVALAAGIIDGLGHGDNTKAAIIRLSYWEILEFMQKFYGDRGFDRNTVFQSCGFGEMFMCLAHDKTLKAPIDRCYGSQNVMTGINLVRCPKKSLEEIERNILSGSTSQGAETLAEINLMLKFHETGASLKLTDNGRRYPIMACLYLICQRKTSPQSLIQTVQNHPAHL